MAINTTKAQRQRRAAEDLAKKLKLEAQLYSSLRTLFKKVSSAASSLFLTNGGRLNVHNSFKQEIASTLYSHYQKVFKEFNDPLRSDSYPELGLAKAAKDSKSSDAVNAALASYAATRSNNSANNISATAQTRLDTAYANAVHEELNGVDEEEEDDDTADLNNDEMDRSSVAGSATLAFDAAYIAGAAVIATTETQAAAETSKNYVVTYEASDSSRSQYTGKAWVTMQDDKVREWHEEADGQEQDPDTPFTVNGEQLQYPGDDSLGASAGNIINCRCSVQYIVNDNSA